ncbi:MAG: tRNA guanosine(15) transglycosylase TgtA [Candidatus Altiarchaeota archaeon]|nr:tRNA guanosine(15) transglycosylase TgtA [Candidatus Altiarchaeota archaeon]
MSGISFDVRRKDVAGRIGRLEINGKAIETPALMPVVNPWKQTITAEELSKKFKVEALMTNSYMILKNQELREDVEREGIHKFLGFDGMIATDSGSYQLMVYGAVETTNKEIIKFQEDIGSDIGSFLDIPTLPDAYKPRAEEQLYETLKRAEEIADAKIVVNAGIQGGKYLDLRKKAAEEIGKRFPLVAIGGIVPLMERYRFSELADIIATVKQNIPQDRVVHAFGLGHPMAFPLAVALGCDLFDSAAYALYAIDGRYMTPYGTENLDELEYLPCSCPVCIEHGLKLKNLYGDDKVKALAEHNLYVSLKELDRVKQAICDGKLWEMVIRQCRSHPNLLAGLQRMLNHSEWIAELDPITKKSAFYDIGEECGRRSEVINVRERVKRVKSDNLREVRPFGMVPAEVADIYPLGSATTFREIEDQQTYKVRDIVKVRALMDYQFGEGAVGLIPDSTRIMKSKNTKRMRWIYVGNEMAASIRASDHFIIPHDWLAGKLKEKFERPKLRVVLDDDEESVACVKEGKSVFCKFVKEVDANLRCGDECIVVDSKDNFVKTGTLMLSPKEIKDFKRGMAVRIR